MLNSMTSPVHVGRAFESLRNSDFNTVSAIGEVIDNSIQADAKNIRIKIKQVPTRKRNTDLTEVAFGDDGMGMSKDILGKCLQLGFSDRYNNRSGIGRFGVGMTLGAITQCTRIEVYSKPRGGGWNFTYLDLDELRDMEDPAIPEPTPAEVPREYAELVAETGTLVVWKNWDREDAKIEEMARWIGRVYRKFIGTETISGEKVVPNSDRRYIFIDDGNFVREIDAMDPLYVTKTAFSSEVAELDKPIILEEEVHKFDRPPGKQSGRRQIVIRTSLLPESWRLKSGMGTSKENRNRRVTENEGISILRNNREVFYGHIPHYKIADKHSSHYKGFIDMDRYWGCEISFNGDLDYWFSVKNIKVGAKPIPELREKIQEMLNDTIHDFRKEIRNTWERTEAKKREETGGTLSGTGEAETVISGQSGILPKPKPDEIETIITDAGGIKKKEREELIVKLADNPVVFRKNFNMDKRGNFIDMTSRGSRVLVDINMNHPFFRKFYDILDTFADTKDRQQDLETPAQSLETNMHLFLGAFVLARKEFKTEQLQSPSDIMDRLVNNWTFFLGKYAKTTLEK